MEQRRFDNLCRSLATGASRRGVLKAIGGGIAGALVAAAAAPVGAAYDRHREDGSLGCGAGGHLNDNGECVLTLVTKVPGNGDGNGNPWVDTGFVLRPGISVVATATGTACIDPDPIFCSGPNGKGAAQPDFALPSAPAGSLIGRIDGGAPFAVGAGPTTITGNGPLQFAQNDSLGNTNNTGFFRVTITATYSPK